MGGGDSVLFARYTGGGGGFCPSHQKRVGGILSGGGGILFGYHGEATNGGQYDLLISSRIVRNFHTAIWLYIL